MPNIVVSERNLVSRGQIVQKLLRPVSRSPTGPSWRSTKSTTNEFILATFDGATPATGHYRDWRFKTRMSGLNAQYFERWVRTEKGDAFLDRAYLHFFRSSGQTENQVLCLHCDPNEPTQMSHSKYKLGPHLHFSLFGAPFGHSHVALAYGFLKEVLVSAESLTSALGRAIEMITEEFIEHL